MAANAPASLAKDFGNDILEIGSDLRRMLDSHSYCPQLLPTAMIFIAAMLIHKAMLKSSALDRQADRSSYTVTTQLKRGLD
jgi:hypothetical protein